MQARSVEALLGGAEKAGPLVVRLHEEHHSQPAETSPASHQGAHPSPFILLKKKKNGEAEFCCPAFS